MQLLVEKTLEYHAVVDPQAETVLTDLATQYEAMIDQAMSLEGDESPAPATNSKQATKQLKEKDQEIKQLKADLFKNKKPAGKDIEKDVLRKKVKELEQENR